MNSLVSTKAINAPGVAVIAALTTVLILRKIMKPRQTQRQLDSNREKRLVVITGCDTGLGYSMAVWALRLGYKVLAGCLNENGEGATNLRQQFQSSAFVVGLDVTDRNSLKNFSDRCKEILDAHEGRLRLWALVANAAVSSMGEFFWQTQTQREQQMQVNFWGTVNYISEFRKLLLKAKARVVVMSSNCSEYPLPYLSTYCASKAAVNSWTKSFRMEMAKYGVRVVGYQPRDFAMKSALFANIGKQYNQMVMEMDSNEKEFYGDYFEEFMKRKLEVFDCSAKKPIEPLDSVHHKQSFMLLLEDDIRNMSVYHSFSLFERIYHGLYTILPQRFVDKMACFVVNPKNAVWQEAELK